MSVHAQSWNGSGRLEFARCPWRSSGVLAGSSVWPLLPLNVVGAGKSPLAAWWTGLVVAASVVVLAFPLLVECSAAAQVLPLASETAPAEVWLPPLAASPSVPDLVDWRASPAVFPGASPGAFPEAWLVLVFRFSLLDPEAQKRERSGLEAETLRLH